MLLPIFLDSRNTLLSENLFHPFKTFVFIHPHFPTREWQNLSQLRSHRPPDQSTPVTSLGEAGHYNGLIVLSECTVPALIFPTHSWTFPECQSFFKTLPQSNYKQPEKNHFLKSLHPLSNTISSNLKYSQLTLALIISQFLLQFQPTL